MKKIIFFLLLILTITMTLTCVMSVKHEQNVNSLLSLTINRSLKERYKLYQTENIYTFLQLDTKTGMIEQVQWSLNPDNEGSVTINSDNLAKELDYGPGSFELYPTKNIYQFILINKTSGNKWHVQWGMESDERWIRRISKI